MSPRAPSTFAIVGDVHGHLQLALCALARLQRERGQTFSAVFLCGDVGTFTEESQLDSATRKHARDNPCELEFLTQWSKVPQPRWLDAIFWPEPQGLGLCCPVVMVHGNHEGFAHLKNLYPNRRRPIEPVAMQSLPPVDTEGRIQLLPPGWITVTDAGYIIGGIGGIEPGQRRANYHSMAYVEEDAVQHLMLHAPKLDVLLTHQGPSQVQGDHGSPTLDLLLESSTAAGRFWFHGHSTPIKTATQVGPTTVVPLGDIAFHHGKPGLDGWAILELHDDEAKLEMVTLGFWREVQQKHWHDERGMLVHPELVRFQ